MVYCNFDGAVESGMTAATVKRQYVQLQSMSIEHSQSLSMIHLILIMQFTRRKFGILHSSMVLYENLLVVVKC